VSQLEIVAKLLQIILNYQTEDVNLAILPFLKVIFFKKILFLEFELN